MVRMSLAASLVLAVLCSATTAQAFFFNTGRPKTVLAGHTVRLNFYTSINPDCSSRGRPTVRITQAPARGRVVIAATGSFPSYARSNTRSVCNTRRVAGTQVSYVASREPGSDSVGIEIIFPDGAFWMHRYSVTIR